MSRCIWGFVVRLDHPCSLSLPGPPVQQPTSFIDPKPIRSMVVRTRVGRCQADIMHALASRPRADAEPLGVFEGQCLQSAIEANHSQAACPPAVILEKHTQNLLPATPKRFAEDELLKARSGARGVKPNPVLPPTWVRRSGNDRSGEATPSGGLGTLESQAADPGLRMQAEIPIEDTGQTKRECEYSLDVRTAAGIGIDAKIRDSVSIRLELTRCRGLVRSLQMALRGALNHLP